ncbi:lysophospholipid acyltransferase family protein [Desulfobacter vibrioformis]|uniref:lysophospholipid acyltransferase family protein n=1 Tax=Desulfobacter vibrioformis TaxID=34031 RepID=UPI001FDFE87A|nr:lysophospholipid acyltransferase family protein [Desulfobacter vibrioformis]
MGINKASKTGHETKTRGNTFLSFTRDLIITLLLWGYFIFGFILFFSPFYLIAFVCPPIREPGIQCLNHLFYKGFFSLVRMLMPGIGWHIDPSVKSLENCIIVGNHVSYLDPLMMIALFRRHKTIVKSTFFKVPVFGWVLRAAGYIPSMPKGRLSSLMVRQTTALASFLEKGGILFVFPEGTRNRNAGKGVLEFHTGVFKMARFCRSPINAVKIRNTDKLFTPGRFLFHTGFSGVISVELAGTIQPDYDNETVSAAGLMEQAKTILSEKQRRSPWDYHTDKP